KQLYEEILAGRGPVRAPLADVRAPRAPGPTAPGQDPLSRISRTRRGENRPTHNLPSLLTSFIGREQEMAEVRRLLGTARRLSLTGTGGCGKTRLALQVAAERQAAEADEVWLVELAALADPTLVPQAVGAALGVPEDPGRPLPQTLIASLQPKQVLLVLDN